MQEIRKLIELAKQDDDEAMMDLIDTFTPIIKKYTRIMNYDEDFKSDIILKFIQVIKNDLNFDEFDEINDYIILKYIQTTIYHHYIALSKHYNKINISESSYDNEIIYNLSDAIEVTNDNHMDKILLEIIESNLTKKEFKCVYFIIFKGYTAVEVSNMLGITKQAVNQCKKRALEKLKKIYQD